LRARTNQTFIIAEAGVNHNGDPELASKLVEMAAGAGADAVKFQVFRTEDIVSVHAPKAQYQINDAKADESQFTMLKRLELSEEAFLGLFQLCHSRGIQFLATPFDLPSLAFLDRLGVDSIKLPSGEITNPFLLWNAARTGRPIILSTGMSTLEEVQRALGVIASGYLGESVESCNRQTCADIVASHCGSDILQEKVTLLHCTSAYPAPIDEANLRAMQTLARKFDLCVGLSDHSKGQLLAIAAVAMGAKVIEKHITLDKQLPGPDHRSSLSPEEFRELVVSIRLIESALGSGEKKSVPSEQNTKLVARKSLVAACDIREGAALTAENIAVKRPGTGISPMDYWLVLGKQVSRDFKKDELIDFLPKQL